MRPDTAHTGGVADDGSWVVRPTIVDGLPLDAAPYCEEIFGPVCIVNRFSTENEAVHLANDTRYGLKAMLFTENLSTAHLVSSRLRAGTVWGVDCFFIRDLRTPFGGSATPASGVRGRLQPGVLHRSQGRRHADPPLRSVDGLTYA
ncbi:aldehyde dehydrogenase family protein [Mobilicoccus massiliensis]|uniref:aldehyde dehydrogenase family protein n=1 Tax=Mobilicoccus massiliensis TaxID=1522310 RepID=UPI00058FCD02|nr:aldehyde dehydrogenase family protein [Mobilicoccus massiliensis]